MSPRNQGWQGAGLIVRALNWEPASQHFLQRPPAEPKKSKIKADR
jgi:hypothetical protein